MKLIRFMSSKEVFYSSSSKRKKEKKEEEEEKRIIAMDTASLKGEDEEGQSQYEGMSRKAIKRHKRFLKRKEAFKEKKAQAKEAKRARKVTAAEVARTEADKDQGGLPGEDPAITEERRQRNRAARFAAKAKFCEDAAEGPQIIFDMTESWELAMTVFERRSLAQQLMYAYGFNKRARRPARLLCTGLPVGGTTDVSLRKRVGSADWLAFEISNTPLEEHLAQLQSSGNIRETNASSSSGVTAIGDASPPRESKSSTASGNGSPSPASPPSMGTPLTTNVVYLTADAGEDQELDELEWRSDAIYVLGGIVDRNRMTRACLKRAQALGIPAARLPMSKYCQWGASNVLTVNHVVEILLRRGGGGESWPDAFQRTLPTRKDPSVSGVSRGSFENGGLADTTLKAPFAHISNSQTRGESQKGASRDGKDPTFCRRDIQSISTHQQQGLKDGKNEVVEEEEEEEEEEVNDS